jgi:hypothetical protein
MKKQKPLYVVKFVGDSYNGLYYSRQVHWGGTERAKATQLTHKEARRVRDVFAGRLQIASVVEPV